MVSQTGHRGISSVNMKHAAWLVLLLSFPAFAQSVPGDNAASANMQKRMESMKLFIASGIGGGQQATPRTVVPLTVMRMNKPTSVQSLF